MPARAAADAMTAPHEALFYPGDLIAGRYRVVVLLGSGGSGEVYEVEDLELKVWVALKTLRSERLENANARERFRREITLARRVSHPNVCRTFDLGTHRLATTAAATQDISFLTMELVRGETLADRLERQGPMSTADALPLVRQMAAGLSAAHSAGVVHRDFKSSNVLLVPTELHQPPRVLITDFGLARLEAHVARRSSAEVTLADVIVGSPAYMAPEQVRSSEVSPQADLYAFGVVLFEMVTGALPFEGDVLATALQKLTQSAPSPSKWVEALDPTWERVILRCLEREPDRRFASLSEALGVLEGTARMPMRRRHWWLATAGGAASLVALGIALGPWREPAPTAHPASGGGSASTPASDATTAGTGTPARVRPAVAVLGLANLSGDASADWIPKAIAEMLRSELAAGRSLRVVPAETVSNMLRDLELRAAEALGPESLERVRRYVHTDTVIAGSAVALGPKGRRTIRVDLRAQDVASGETLAPIVEEGEEKDLVALVVAAGSRMRSQLGALALSQAERREALSALPGPGAAALYAEGLERLRQADALAARDLLEKAVEIQEDYPLAHSALASAWSALGYDARALTAARRAFELSADLPLAERLWIEGSYHEIAGDPRRAAEVFATLWSLHSDQLDYAIRLAAAQARSGQQMAALTVIESLRQLPAPDRDDPRIDLAEAEASSAAADFRRAASAAKRAVERGRAREQRWLVARALLAQAWAQRNLGEAEAGQAAVAEARRLFDESRQPDGAARSLTLLSTFHRDRGDLQGARRLDEEALAVFRRIGNERQAALALNNFGKGLALGGDLEMARVRLQEALEICRRIEDREGIARQTNNLAEVTLALGNALAAEPLYREAGAACRESGDRRICADVARGLGDALSALGKLEAAESSYRESLQLARELEHRRYEAYSLHGLGEILAQRGQLASAREHHELARSIRTELGERANAANSALALARLALAESQPRLAETLAGDAERQLGPEQRDQRATALALRVRALAAAGNSATALRLAATLRGMIAGAQNPRTAQAVALAEAELAVAATDIAQARKVVLVLEDLAAHDRRDGRLPEALEVEIAAASARRLFDLRAALAGAQHSESEARESGLLRLAGEAARVADGIRDRDPALAKRATRRP